MNRSLFLICAIALVGASAQPGILIAGSIRDQFGHPIAGARIESADRSVPEILGRTDADGTFAFEARGVKVVDIRCSFCQSERVPVGSDGTVVAIVRRFVAIAANAPTPEDVASLPYGRAESILSLTPFVVLSDSRAAVPGPQLSDRGVSRDNGLLVDNGVVNYDIVAGISPFYTIPSHDTADVAVRGVQDAYRYGDVAGDGTFAIGGDAQVHPKLALFGGERALRFSFGNQTVSAGAAYSADSLDQRSRVEGVANWERGDTAEFAGISSASGQHTSYGGDTISSSFSSARMEIEQRAPIEIDATLTADRGGYAIASPLYPVSAEWSDVDARVTMHSNAPIAAFATLAVRQSSGWYGSTSATGFLLATTRGQAQSIAGVRFRGRTLEAIAAYGLNDVRYDGAYLSEQPKAATANDAVLAFTYRPSSLWTLDASLGTSYRLPTFLELYGNNPDSALSIDRDRTLEATLQYSNNRRLRTAITALHRRANGFDAGSVSSLGAMVAWQFAPKLSVRAWALRVMPDLHSSSSLLRFGIDPRRASVGSTWVTYDNDGAFRIDAIWRRDVLDWEPSPHLDASASGRLSARLWWYAASHSRDGKRYTDLG